MSITEKQADSIESKGEENSRESNEEDIEEDSEENGEDVVSVFVQVGRSELPVYAPKTYNRSAQRICGGHFLAHRWADCTWTFLCVPLPYRGKRVSFRHKHSPTLLNLLSL